MLVEQRGKELCDLQSVKGNNKTKRNRKRSSKKSMISVVQQLFQTCKEVFAIGGSGFVPSPQDIEKLRLVLDGMKPEDVGLSRDMPYFRKTEKKGAPPITYLHVYECGKFSIGIFCLPPSGVIPLHNHPGMTVFSKLLFGSMHIKSYDWVKDAPDDTKENLNPTRIQPPGTRLAKVNTDSVFTAPCNTNILYPAAGGNLHCFTALTACAVIDVLGPPYSDPEGRHCMYYRDVPALRVTGVGEENVAVNEAEKYAWLEEKEKPDKVFVVGALYRGPKIIQN
ncbi:cysteamine dioxygenase [Ranunculus cassubicifolius]